MMNLMIAYANWAGDRWAAWVVATSLGAAVLLALVSLAWCVIRNRVAPHVGYGLFLLVPLKLLVPFVVTVPSAVAQWTPSALIASWFTGGSAPQGTGSRSPVETPGSAVTTGRIVLSGSSSKLSSKPIPRSLESHRPELPPNVRSSERMGRATAVVSQSVKESAALSGSARLMLAWLAVVVPLFARLLGNQIRFRTRTRNATPIDLSTVGISVRDLCRRADVPDKIEIDEHDSIAVPSVLGIVRPRILLPCGIASILTTQQLRWALLHEFAHIRRRDLIVVALQRAAAILHFFNPAIWIATRAIHQLREFACNDLALSLSEGSAVDGVRILRLGNPHRNAHSGALGVLGFNSRSSCFSRLRRLLDADRPIRTSPGLLSICALVLIALVSLPQFRAVGDSSAANSQAPAAGSATKNQSEPKVSTAAAKEGQEFELLVVGPGAKPIPDAVVEIAATPNPAAEQVRKGKLAIRPTMESGTVALQFGGRGGLWATAGI